MTRFSAGSTSARKIPAMITPASMNSMLLPRPIGYGRERKPSSIATPVSTHQNTFERLPAAV